MENVATSDRPNPLKDKSYAFALRIIRVYKFLLSEHKEFVPSKQLLRSGTSIGANIAEANQAQSKPDFFSKLSIALKEAVETEYWVSLLRDSDYLSEAQGESLIADCSELKAMLTASIKSTKRRI